MRVMTAAARSATAVSVLTERVEYPVGNTAAFDVGGGVYVTRNMRERHRRVRRRGSAERCVSERRGA